MWTKERILRAAADAPRLCVLFLVRDTDGAWLVGTFAENGAVVPCRKAQEEKTAVRRMAELFRKTAEKNCRVTVAFAHDTWTAAFLAGQIGKNTTFEPLDPQIGELALLYSGSLRASPPV